MSNLIKKSLSRSAAKLAMLALGVGGFAVQKAHAVDIVCGGNIQIINLLNCNPQLGLDFTSDATDLTVATFTISNNTSQFELDLSFLHGGAFVNAGGTQKVDLTKLTIGPEGTGTLGTGPVVLVPGNAAEGASFIAGGDLTLQMAPGLGAVNTAIKWTPVAQTTATTGYVLQLLGSWSASSNLAGLYTETITATLVATL